MDEEVFVHEIKKPSKRTLHERVFFDIKNVDYVYTIKTPINHNMDRYDRVIIESEMGFDFCDTEWNTHALIIVFKNGKKLGVGYENGADMYREFDELQKEINPPPIITSAVPTSPEKKKRKRKY